MMISQHEIEKVTCDKCNGKGWFVIEESWWGSKYKPCPKCKGFKELDWIEMIKGKDLVEPFESSYYKKGTLSSGPR